MTIKEYQKMALETFQVMTYRKEYLELGIRGESGEVCDKIKKLIRDDEWEPGMEVPDLKKIGLLKEMGDTMWYTVVYAHVTGKPVSCARIFDKMDLNKVETYCINDMIECAIQMTDCIKGHINTWEIVVYIATMAKILGTDLETVCQKNIDKLADRYARDKIKGSGDDR